MAVNYLYIKALDVLKFTPYVADPELFIRGTADWSKGGGRDGCSSYASVISNETTKFLPQKGADPGPSRSP